MRKRELKDEIRRLRHLIRHAWVHGAYDDCGYNQMTTDQKADYRRVIGRSDAEQADIDEARARSRRVDRPQCTCRQPTRFGYCPVHEADR